MKTQGTQLYAIDPANGQVLAVQCVTSIDGIDAAKSQIPTTCLEETEAETYEAGLGQPGQATFGVNSDPSNNASHLRLHQLKVAGTSLQWAVGWSDATGTAPTVDSDGEFDLPPNRTWLLFKGYMTAFPFSFAQNTTVQSNVGIQVSGEPVLIPREPVSS